MKHLSVVRSPVASPRTSVNFQSARQAMVDQYRAPTCLSALPHLPNADADSLFQHYLGCLEFHQRAYFLDQNNEFWMQQLKDEVTRLSAGNPTSGEKNLREEAEASVRKNIQALAVSLEAQYKRTAVLRLALSREKPSTQWDPNTPRDNYPEPESKSFVDYVDLSRRRWRQSREYRIGMEKVQNWRRNRGLPVDETIDPTGKSQEEMEEPGRARVQEIVKYLRGHDSITEEISPYDLERDVNAYLIQYTRLNKSTDAKLKSQLGDPKMRHLEVHSYEEGMTDVRFKGKFPDQRLSIDWFCKSSHSESGYYYNLPKDSNHTGADQYIWSKDECDKRDPTRMRYLHIPANNMTVSSLQGVCG